MAFQRALNGGESVRKIAPQNSLNGGPLTRSFHSQDLISDSAQLHERSSSATHAQPAPPSTSQPPELEFVVVSANSHSRDGHEYSHRCFVALRSRTVRWGPRSPFTNDVLPLDCSPIPDASMRALWDAAERLGLSVTGDAPSWMLCGAQGFST